MCRVLKDIRKTRSITQDIIQHLPLEIRRDDTNRLIVYHNISVTIVECIFDYLGRPGAKTQCTAVRRFLHILHLEKLIRKLVQIAYHPRDSKLEGIIIESKMGSSKYTILSWISQLTSLVEYLQADTLIITSIKILCVLKLIDRSTVVGPPNHESLLLKWKNVKPDRSLHLHTVQPSVEWLNASIGSKCSHIAYIEAKNVLHLKWLLDFIPEAFPKSKIRKPFQKRQLILSSGEPLVTAYVFKSSHDIGKLALKSNAPLKIRKVFPNKLTFIISYNRIIQTHKRPIGPFKRTGENGAAQATIAAVKSRKFRLATMLSFSVFIVLIAPGL
ncbi:hypothetical protein RF11_04390 [Thelohanellus kitauei]|uniref:Uncharacterized protein n=1 Tax=Thelohanellus kitauei TaxID=669202 RepID=A0A0C2MVU2_THEKT|nr:hypothetical protein RF11_04390 [Thelohanellus kitauei]